MRSWSHAPPAANGGGTVEPVGRGGAAAVEHDDEHVLEHDYLFANRAPTLRFLSLRRLGVRVYARFRVCDDSSGRITVVERDDRPRSLIRR